MTSILIVDDHAGFRRSVRSLLSAEGFEVVGEAAGGQEALAAVERLRPAVVLLDIQLPDVDGFEVAATLARAPDPPQVILISSRDARSYGHLMSDADVAGFLSKSQLTAAAIRSLTG